MFDAVQLAARYGARRRQTGWCPWCGASSATPTTG